VRTIAEVGLHFEKPLTFFVGENGSGKSTLVEAIAQAFGIDTRGGHGGRKYATNDEPNELGSMIVLRPPLGDRRRIRSFFLRVETALGVLEFMSESGVSGYGDRHAAEVSHGESFLQVIEGRFEGPGLYLLDEPESALSFRSCLALMATLHDLAGTGSQIICSTHSPLLTALPGATILELSESGIVRKDWLELVQRWTEFLQDPGRYLRYLLE
jgi:predicted ATPase